MEWITSTFFVLIGLLVRLAIPILVTILLIALLRKLDEHWRVEGTMPVVVEKPECWKIMDCPPEKVVACKGASSPLPCWQAYRLPNGYLHEECLTCKVFIDAPTPALKVEPRRM